MIALVVGSGCLAGVGYLFWFLKKSDQVGHLHHKEIETLSGMNPLDENQGTHLPSEGRAT